MDTKLTLKLDGRVIASAKRYAREKNISLSGLVENYFQKLTRDQGKKETNSQSINPLVKSLSGIITVSKEKDHKKDYSDYLVRKYK